MEQTKSKLDAEVKRLKKELENAKSSNTTKINNLTTELSELKKEKEKLLSQIDQEKQSKEAEVSMLKKKVNSLEKTGLNTKRMNEMRQTYNEKILSKLFYYDMKKQVRMIYICQVTVAYISDLEEQLKKGEQEYNNLNEKYIELGKLKTQFEADNEALNK